MPSSSDKQDDTIVQRRCAKWNEHAGPRVGDFCIIDGGMRRVARVSGIMVQITPPNDAGRFHLNDDGLMLYTGALGQMVPKGDLVQRIERRGGSCSVDLHRRGVHTTVPHAYTFYSGDNPKNLGRAET